MAASMAKHGLRSFSGPFDWCLSDFSGVLHFLEIDFEDFLSKENLRIVDEQGKEFEDVKYKIFYNHDIRNEFRQEYQEIYEKYFKRVNKFRKEIRKGVCFIRAVRSVHELHYIQQNEAYIKKVKKYHIDNEIVYIIQDSFAEYIALGAPFFKINRSYESGEGLRQLFDENDDFLSYCVGRYNESVIKDNIVFDLKKELNKLKNIEVRHKLLLKILYADYDAMDLPESLDIWCGG